MKFFSKLHKENNRNNKNVFTYLVFCLLSLSIFFSNSTFNKEALCFITFILSLWSNTLTLKAYLNTYVKKNLKKTLILKFHPGWSVYMSFFLFFIPGWNFIPFFLKGMSSSQDEISSRQKRVNSKRHFTIDRDDFIPGPKFHV